MNELKNGDMLMACIDFDELDVRLALSMSKADDNFNIWCEDSQLNEIKCGDLCVICNIEKRNVHNSSFNLITILHNERLLKICNTDVDFSEIWMIIE